jgi:hypothetical protein
LGEEGKEVGSGRRSWGGGRELGRGCACVRRSNPIKSFSIIRRFDYRFDHNNKQDGYQSTENRKKDIVQPVTGNPLVKKKRTGILETSG